MVQPQGPAPGQMLQASAAFDCPAIPAVPGLHLAARGFAGRAAKLDQVDGGGPELQVELRGMQQDRR